MAGCIFRFCTDSDVGSYVISARRLPDWVLGNMWLGSTSLDTKVEKYITLFQSNNLVMLRMYVVLHYNTVYIIFQIKLDITSLTFL